MIAAAHEDLEATVESQRFRKDLFARLRRSLIRISPLRQRRAQILPLLSTQAITATAIAVDAFYAIIRKDIDMPEVLVPTWRKKRTARHQQITEVLWLEVVAEPCTVSLPSPTCRVVAGAAEDGVVSVIQGGVVVREPVVASGALGRVGPASPWNVSPPA